MPALSAVMKDRIMVVLDSTRYARQGFIVNYDDVKNPVATTIFSNSPEYRFVICTSESDGFITSETPGGTFQRGNFESCMKALSDWANRIVDDQSDWILDEFGGAADRNPSL
jgi:hypothetical protein